MVVGVGAGIALVLLLSFMIAVASAMLRHLDLDCSCFGLLYRERIGWSVLARDGILAGLALGALLVESGRFALPTVVRALHRPSDILAFALTLAVAAASLSVLIPLIGRRPRGSQTSAAQPIEPADMKS